MIQAEDMELFDLVAEGHAALAAPVFERVSLALAVLPKLVAALDRVALYQHEMREIRSELTLAVRKLREEVWEAQKTHPEVTYRSAKVHAALVRVNEILGKLDRLIFTGEGTP
jgi:hypothetical protein